MAGVLGAWICVTALGVTTSSIGISFMTFDGATDGGVVVGSPQPVRSDEWSRNSPQRLGVMRLGYELGNPMSEGSYGEYGVRDGLAAAVVYFDNTLARLGTVLPDAQLFALLWWWPYVVTALAMPYLLSMLGVRPFIAIGITLLTLLSPPMAWWTTMAPLAVGVVFGATALLVAAVTHTRTGPRRWWVVSAIGAGILLARTILVYPRWTVPLVLVVMVPMVVVTLLPSHGVRELLAVGLAGGVALVLVFLVVLGNLPAVEALADTVEPGAVRTPAGGESVWFLVSAHLTGPTLSAYPDPVDSNQSELATGFALLAVAGFAAWWPTRGRAGRPERVFVCLSLGTAAALVVWAIAPWPGWSADLLLARVLKPWRIVQIIGVATMCLFAVMVEGVLRRAGSVWYTGLVGAGVFVTLVLSGLWLRSTSLPNLPVATVLVLAGATAVAVWLALQPAYVRIGVVALVTFAFIGTATAGPIQVGLADLRGAEFDDVALIMAAAAGDRSIASDSQRTSALAVASGISSLSGDMAAPSTRWQLLDPERRYRDVWNRSAIVLFAWSPDRDSPTISLPQRDVVLISMDPCGPEADAVGLGGIVSRTPVIADCLAPIGRFGLGPSEMFVYTIDG